MPRNQFQRMVFAFLTVVITVHVYVFYSLYVVNGNILMQVTGEQSVLAAIRAQGGVYMFGRMLPIWTVIVVEFCLAFILENLVGSPLSFRLACMVFNPQKNHPMIFETAIICATVGIMCPAMSFIAAFLYYPYYNGFNIWTLFANWLKLVCFNFPLAYFSQLFFIQPCVRVLFKTLFRKDIEKRSRESAETMQKEGKNKLPADETEAVADIFKRIEEIKGEIKEELIREMEK
ncbi:MAG: hypothetical protein IJ794_01265 [Lachnospiraceae bacterium]|nr:hypothetical protein [Lachnospiraceae bacterium]